MDKVSFFVAANCRCVYDFHNAECNPNNPEMTYTLGSFKFHTG